MRQKKTADDKTAQPKKAKTPRVPSSKKENQGPPVIEPSTVYDVNPFMPHLVRNMVVKKKPITVSHGSEMILKDKEEGTEHPGAVRFVQINDVDTATFVKIFASNVQVLFSLTAPGITTFMYLTYLLSDPKYMLKDHLRITWDMYQHHMKAILKDKAEEVSMSRPTFYRGVNDLVVKGVLAPANIEGEKRGWYFLNPSLCFNGDRIAIVKEYVKAKETRAGEWRLEQDPWNVAEKVVEPVPNDEISFGQHVSEGTE